MVEVRGRLLLRVQFGHAPLGYRAVGVGGGLGRCQKGARRGCCGGVRTLAVERWGLGSERPLGGPSPIALLGIVWTITGNSWGALCNPQLVQATCRHF